MKFPFSEEEIMNFKGLDPALVQKRIIEAFEEDLDLKYDRILSPGLIGLYSLADFGLDKEGQIGKLKLLENLLVNHPGVFNNYQLRMYAQSKNFNLKIFENNNNENSSADQR